TIVIPLWSPKATVRYVYYAFAFSIPFEVIDIGLPYTPSKLFGYLLILLTLLMERDLFLWRPPKAFWCFVIYLIVYAFRGIIEVFGDPQKAEFRGEIIGQLFTMCQMLVLFWISYNLMRSERVKKGTVLALALSCSVLAFLQALGITNSNVAQERISAFGENPNTLASVLSLGLLALVGVAYARK